MKIKTLLQIVAYLTILLTIVMGLTFYWFANYQKTETDRNFQINQIIDHLSDLQALTYEYTKDHFDRPRIQWKLKLKKLKEIISTLDNKDSEDLFTRIQRVLADVEASFNELINLFKNRGKIGEKYLVLSKEYEERLLAQLHLKIKKFQALIISLGHISDQKLLNGQKLTDRLILAFIVIYLTGIAFISILLRKKLVGPLDKIQIATESYGLGKKSVKLEIRAKDEIGNLAITFNEMIARRQQTELELKQYQGNLEELIEQRASEINEISRFNELILKSAGEGIYGLDLDGVTTFANPTAEKMLAYSFADMADCSLHSLIHHSKPDGTPYPSEQSLICAAFKDGKVHHVADEVFWRKDGTCFPIEYVSTPIRKDGKLVGAVVTFKDITERKQAEEKLKHFATELARSNQDLLEFCHIVSHDLKAPLRHVITFGDLLKSEYSEILDDNGKDYLTHMRNATSRMHKFIEDLLEFSKVKTKSQLFQPVNIETIVTHALQDLETLLTESNGQVRIQQLPTLDADLFQMRQLFQNLIGNALKFHKKDLPPVVILSSQHKSRGFWEITVEDNGIGFDEKYHDRIYKPFQRLHAQSKYEGSGIGLAVCKKIVDRHGGKITAKSFPQQGTTFTITLPEKQPQKS